MSRKPDRRVQRTIELLRHALITLSGEKGYNAVTIQDITRRASLGRATFYLHFKDKDSLLMSTLQATVDELLARVGPDAAERLRTGELSLVLTVFQHAAENSTLYDLILNGEGAASVERQLREFSAEITQQYLTALLRDNQPLLPVELAANYFANALMGLLKWWLEQDQPYTPEYMTEAFYRMGVIGMFEALGLPTDTMPFKIRNQA